MTNVGLYITLEPASGKAVTVARICDRRLLVNAAESKVDPIVKPIFAFNKLTVRRVWV